MNIAPRLSPWVPHRGTGMRGIRTSIESSPESSPGIVPGDGAARAEVVREATRRRHGRVPLWSMILRLVLGLVLVGLGVLFMGWHDTRAEAGAAPAAAPPAR